MERDTGLARRCYTSGKICVDFRPDQSVSKPTTRLQSISKIRYGTGSKILNRSLNFVFRQQRYLNQLKLIRLNSIPDGNVNHIKTGIIMNKAALNEWCKYGTLALQTLDSASAFCDGRVGSISGVRWSKVRSLGRMGGAWGQTSFVWGGMDVTSGNLKWDRAARCEYRALCMSLTYGILFTVSNSTYCRLNRDWTHTRTTIHC